ncbi:YtxH domain-containing protein [Lacticaseibacillus kribbianus]|uniref:YtxH domain-containing protein n=1 Tax=Lacticaseibacillus kribbianus TaxID=2926292 RepID=UPI001CD261D7|nr:YtxH domain-containing protein [Lacticaseibacillus kribbianus]
MKFTTGFLIGAAVGTTYALLTAKKTGPARQRDFVAYTDGITDATRDVQHAVTRLGKAATELKATIAETLTPNVEAIQDAVTDFSFQTEAHTKALNAHVEKINDALEAVAPAIDADPQA